MTEKEIQTAFANVFHNEAESFSSHQDVSI